MRNIFFVAVAIALASLMMVPDPDAFAPERAKYRQSRPEKRTQHRGGGDVVLHRRSGHFFAEVEVNGPINMLADTGASVVALSVDDAEAAGINVDTLRFSAVISTANGQTAAAPVILDEVSVGSITRTNVRALVTRDMEGSLLGMSFFDTLSKVAIASNEMVLED